MKLGIFDSGIGGKAVEESLVREFPAASILRVDDHENLPYGDKSLEEVRKLTDIAIQPLLLARCDIIILACNTATAAAIEYLRAKYPEQKFIGLEPMIKPAAALSNTGVVAICATPATLASQRYKNLKETFGSKATITEPDCSTWAKMIEDNAINEIIIRKTISGLCKQSVDVIVLACTHYHWIKKVIIDEAGSAMTVLDPSDAITRRIRTLINS